MNQRTRRPTHSILYRITAVFALTSCLAAQEASPTSNSAAPRALGRLLVSVSDADMIPSAYANGDLGPAVGTDALSVIRLDRPLRDLKAVEIPVSNSVTGPPASLVVTPDGRYAIVVETRKAKPIGKRDAKLAHLAPGSLITVVDLADPDKPAVVQTVEGYRSPDSICINAAGTLVAITHSRAGDGETIPLAFYRFREGRLSKLPAPLIPSWTLGDYLINVAFHPNENVLALLNATKPALSFVRYSEAPNDAIALQPWGNVIAVETAPYLARFTPDGRHVLVNGSYAAFGLNADGAAPRGTVSSIRLAAAVSADGLPQHQLVSRAETGVIPEGLSISPSGRFAVTANLENSWRPADDARLTHFSSITLLRIDPSSGLLDRIGDYPIDGLLPEMAVFDASSRFVAVTVHSQSGSPLAAGHIDFWRIDQDPNDTRRIEFVKTRHSVPVTRGPHSMILVP